MAVQCGTRVGQVLFTQGLADEAFSDRQESSHVFGVCVLDASQ